MEQTIVWSCKLTHKTACVNKYAPVSVWKLSQNLTYSLYIANPNPNPTGPSTPQYLNYPYYLIKRLQMVCYALQCICNWGKFSYHVTVKIAGFPRAWSISQVVLWNIHPFLPPAQFSVRSGDTFVLLKTNKQRLFSE